MNSIVLSYNINEHSTCKINTLFKHKLAHSIRKVLIIKGFIYFEYFFTIYTIYLLDILFKKKNNLKEVLK